MRDRCPFAFATLSFFSTIITGEDIINGKPHPEPYGND